MADPNLSTEVEGTLRYTMESGALYMDCGETRIEITDFVKGLTEEQIRAIVQPLPKVYISTDSGRLLVYDNEREDWITIGGSGAVDWADNAGTATYAFNAGTATKAYSSDHATNAGSAVYAVEATHAGTADYGTNAGTADHALLAETAIYALNGGTSTEAEHAVNADTATYAINAGTSVQADHADTATYAGTADYGINAGTSTYAVNAGTSVQADHADTATYAVNAGTATEANHAELASTADYGINAGTATEANHAELADTATYAVNAGTVLQAAHSDESDHATNADTSTYAVNAGTSDYATNAGTADHAINADTATYALNGGTSTDAEHAVNADTATYAVNAGTSSAAEKLTNSVTIDGFQSDFSQNQNSIAHYYECDSNADEAVKVVYAANIKLINGARIIVKFPKGNTCDPVNLKLQLNSNDPKDIKYNSGPLPKASSIQVNSVKEFVYYNNCFHIIGDIDQYKEYFARDGVSYDTSTSAFYNSGVRAIVASSVPGNINVNTNGSTANIEVLDAPLAIKNITREEGTNTFTATCLNGSTFNFYQKDTLYNFSGVSFVSGDQSTGTHDANAATENGNYDYSSNGPATSIGASANNGALFVASKSTSYVAQIAQNYSNGALFVRGKDNGTWSSWRQVAYQSDITTLQSNFQAGVDSVYDAIVAEGTTPASKSLSDVVSGITTMSTDRYNAGTVDGYNTKKNQLTGTYTPSSNGSGLDMGADHTYRYVNTNTVYNAGTATGYTSGYNAGTTDGYNTKKNQLTATYTPGSNGNKLDMGADHTYRYVNTNTVYNSGTTDGYNTKRNQLTATYTPSSNGNKLDMGSNHSYRYVNTNTVYNAGTATGYTSGYNAGTTAGYNTKRNQLTATYTPSSNGNKLDMGSNHSYRYVNTNTVYNSGYNNGTKNGYSSGYNAGTSAGYSSGYNAGTAAGYTSGYNQGKSDGRAEIQFVEKTYHLTPTSEYYAEGYVDSTYGSGWYSYLIYTENVIGNAAANLNGFKIDYAKDVRNTYHRLQITVQPAGATPGAKFKLSDGPWVNIMLVKRG